MAKWTKLAHLGGLVAFLGSIFTFTLISGLAENAGLDDLVFGRQIISAGTDVLTLPGLWVLAVTGLWMGYKTYGFGQRFILIKTLLMIAMIINAHFFVMPAVDSATELAAMSQEQGRLLPAYKAAYLKESIHGAVNVVLAVAAAVVGIWKPGLRRSVHG